jgi:O-antigen/teichoic acid export membrane protein
MLNDPSSVPFVSRTLLKHRVLGASAWRLAGQCLSQGIRFAGNLLMTRLLVPEMFGVTAIATVVMIGLAMFSDVGLKQNVIQSKRGNDPVFLNTVWVTQILRGVLLWFFALCVSLLIFAANRLSIFPKDSVYANPDLPYVVAILSVTVVVGGFQSTKLYEASRNLSLSRVIRIEIAAQITGLICMIGWASVDRSIWALVVGANVSSLTGVVLGHLWLPGVSNRWCWDHNAFREIFHFGKWIFLSSLLGFFVNSGDRLLLGGLVDASVLGVYTIAFTIFSTIEQPAIMISNEILFPALGEIRRERPDDLFRNYYRVHGVISACTYLCAGVLMNSGEAIIGLLYDRRYEQAGWMLEILSAALMTAPFHIVTQCFMLLGMPGLLSQVCAIRAAVLFTCLPLGFHFFGMAGALGGIIVSYFSIFPTIILFKLKYKLFDLRKELYLLVFLLVGAVVGKILVGTVEYLQRGMVFNLTNLSQPCKETDHRFKICDKIA